MNELMQKSVLKTMSSLEIAELTGKEHSNVLRDIRNMLSGLGYSELNSNIIQGITVILNERNQTKEILLDQDHALTLVSGYEVKLRMAIVKRWQELEQKEQLKPLTTADHLRLTADLIERQEKLEQEQIEANIRLLEVERRQEALDAKQQAITEGFQYFTVLAYSVINHIQVDLSTASRLGKRAAELSREQGVLIDRVRDPRFGYVNAYQQAILDKVFAEEMS